MNVRVHLSPRNAHLGTFDEVAETVRCGLKRLAATGFALPDRTILIGAHELAPDTRPDDHLIFYNFEQRDSPLLNAAVLNLFRQHEVWDYSASNIAWLAERGVRAKHVPLGYVPELKRIKKAATQDIDVLFYGLINNRRQRILDGLRKAGLSTCEVFNCYGHGRDQLIARSKVVLNIHFYNAHIFEIVRCAYLFANEICVVSEESVDVPPELAGVLPHVPYDRLVSTCVRLADNPDEASLWAANAHAVFRTRDEVDILRKAINGPRA